MKKTTHLLTSAAILFGATFAANAALVTGTWTSPSGGTVTGQNTASPTLGDGTSNSADNENLYSTFPTLTMVNVGDKLTLSGSVTMTGISTGATGQFRVILFNGTDSSTTSGYMVLNGNGTTDPKLRERASGNYYSNTGSSEIATGTAPGTGVALVDNASYDLSLTLELLAGNQLAITSSLTNGGNDYMNISFTDATPSALGFSNVGFLSGGSLNADQLSFSNIDVTLTPIPEPTIALLGGLGVLGLLRRRR